MKIEEAIKINTEVGENPRSAIRSDFPAANQLGIEALKRLEVLRLKPYLDPRDKLPGETEGELREPNEEPG